MSFTDGEAKGWSSVVSELEPNTSSLESGKELAGIMLGNELVFHCCEANDHKLNDFKLHKFIIFYSSGCIRLKSKSQLKPQFSSGAQGLFVDINHFLVVVGMRSLFFCFPASCWLGTTLSF